MIISVRICIGDEAVLRCCSSVLQLLVVLVVLMVSFNCNGGVHCLLLSDRLLLQIQNAICLLVGLAGLDVKTLLLILGRLYSQLRSARLHLQEAIGRTCLKMRSLVSLLLLLSSVATCRLIGSENTDGHIHSGMVIGVL